VTQMHGSVPLAIAAYNAGPEAISRWAAQLGEVPLPVFIELIPFAETRAYVVSVLGYWARYGYLRGGAAGVPQLPLELPAELLK
jgi:soluble lytic murein transglycosylase